MKKGKKALIIVLCVVCLGGVVGGLVGFAQTAVQKDTPDAFLSQWMSGIRDATLLKQTVIPGSHDAGTQGMLWVSETQDKGIAEQLACGVRYFDIRATEKQGKLVVYHGPIKGKEVLPMLDTIAAFLQEHPTETVIVDFQHFEENAQERVLSYVRENWKDRMIKNDTAKDDLTFVDALTMADCRGKILAFVSDATFAQENHFFLRNDDEGNRAGTSLQSYYDEKLNKGNAKAYWKDGLDYYIGKYKEYDKGLFVLQGQLTDGLLFLGPKFREAENKKGMDDYVSNLHASDDLLYINVVMRDYVSAKKCKAIVLLNASKNNVKEEAIFDFVA